MKAPEQLIDETALQSEAYAIADGRIMVMPSEGMATIDDVPALGIKGRKLDILTLLAGRPDSTVSIPDICTAVWGEDSLNAAMRARVHVSNLREELGDELGNPVSGAIVTKRRAGYRAVSSLTGTDDVRLSEGSHYIADRRVAVDTTNMSVMSDGHLLEDVTPTQFRLLAELAKRPDRVVGYHTLLSAVWGYSDRGTFDSARVHISSFRRRLGDELGNPRTGALRTRFGIGYYAVSSLGGGQA